MPSIEKESCQNTHAYLDGVSRGEVDCEGRQLGELPPDQHAQPLLVLTHQPSNILPGNGLDAVEVQQPRAPAWFSTPRNAQDANQY